MINGFYINLDERKDRYNHFEKLKRHNLFLKNINRFSAIKNSNGALGCTMSHYNALKIAYEKYKNDECIVIFEDDFCILNENIFNDFINDFELIKNNKDWSIITFTRRSGTYYGKYDNKFNYIKGTQTMSGYIIKTIFIQSLINKLEIGITNMKNGLSEHNNTCDQIWKSLQNENNFIYYNNVFAGQLPSYSNLEKCVVNYNSHFINEKNIVDFIFLIFSTSNNTKGWYNNISNNMLYIKVIGDNSITEKYLFDNSTNTLYMKMDNSISVLQDNILEILAVINMRFEYNYIFKINYNLKLINSELFINLLNGLNKKTYNFVGGIENNNLLNEFINCKCFFLLNTLVKDLLQKKLNNIEDLSMYINNLYKENTKYFNANNIFKTF